MIVLIDNYDSFSYNLYQMIGTLDPDITVVRNDAVDVAGVRAMAPDHIVLSPGPGRPEAAGICQEVARGLAGEVPILGVCLGHQAIAAAFGGIVVHARHLMHGKQSTVSLDTTCLLFAGMPAQIEAGRYHSLSVEEDSLPTVLTAIARADDGELMAVKHRDLPVFGIQFHPESILTPSGGQILENFLHIGFP